jgi:hypothetical protein
MGDDRGHDPRYRSIDRHHPPLVITGSEAGKASGSTAGKGDSQWKHAEGLKSKLNSSMPRYLYY